MSGPERSLGLDTVKLVVGHRGRDQCGWQWDWLCEQWEQDKVEHVLKRLLHDDPGSDVAQRDGVTFIRHNLGGKDVWQPVSEGLPSDLLRRYGVEADDAISVAGNLLLNEGIGRLLDLSTAATSNQVAGNPWSNGNAFVGVGDSATAEAATQTELSAATNRFYKAQNATYPISPGSNGAQSRDWRSDFTTTEANWAWQEWTIAAGATTASGAGFTNGTINLNRKVQSLGTKSSGTWTMTGTVTLS